MVLGLSLDSVEQASSRELMELSLGHRSMLMPLRDHGQIFARVLGHGLHIKVGRESSLPATPRCAAAGAFVLHCTTARVSTGLTVRVHLDPKWLRRWSWLWCVCVEGGEEEGERR